MPDKKLSIAIVLIIVLVVGHDIDHFVRGDFRAGSAAEALPIVLVTVAKYAAFGLGLFLYLRNSVGPGFWAVLAGIGVVLGWLAHFSPFSGQPPQVIYRVYGSPVWGSLAVAWLVALMLLLIATVLYALYLWARASR